MRHEIRTVKFTCDGWYYRDGDQYSEQDCAAALELTGTGEEIDEKFRSYGWTTDECGCKHTCNGVHGSDSLNNRAAR